MAVAEILTGYGGFETTDAYSHFIECVRDPRKKCIAPGEQNIQILDGIARSAKSGKEVKL